MSVRGRVWRALTRDVAATEPEHVDPRLRGRTYAVPFDRVWRAALDIASGGIRRWTVLESDDDAGVIRARAGRLLGGDPADVTITIVLDQDAQTRVDARSASAGRGPDLGANARRIARFFRELDERSRG